MRFVIDIPDAFLSHWNEDRFKDSLMRLNADAHLLAGNYEQETVTMLIKAFQAATPLAEQNTEPNARSVGTDITVGDIVYADGVYGIVTRRYVVGADEEPFCGVLHARGVFSTNAARNLRKTGKCYPQLSEILDACRSLRLHDNAESTQSSTQNQRRLCDVPDINVGDIVRVDRVYGIATRCCEHRTDTEPYCGVLCENGNFIATDIRGVYNTGRHKPELAVILNALLDLDCERNQLKEEHV